MRIIKRSMKTYALLLLASITIAVPLAAQTNSISCLPTGQELVRLPEATSKDGILKATIRTQAEQVRMTTGAFGTSPVLCYPQWIRAYRLGGLPAQTAQTELLDPLPGPLLRANVGDLVELTFLNTIDPSKFPNSDSGCDKTSTYPGQTGPGNNPDQYPDCFALSTTTNMHFHGTHTNPDSTGDNVFLEIKPSPRSKDAARVPVVTADTVKGPFADFFAQCEAELPPTNLPKQWPRFWDDWPQSLRDYQQNLLETYAPDLWKRNKEMIRRGAWPQYYLGNYPYCFRLPKYTASTWPPPKKSAVVPKHLHGAGSAEHDEAAQPERDLIMGQSPGTHWYHAHKHGATTINVMNGMTGVFIIEDNSPTGYDGFIAAAYKEFPSFKQQVIVINQLGTTPSLERGGGGGPGPHFSVNGRLQPTITMKGGEVQLWRIANSGSRAGMNILAPEAGELSWRQTAQDGVQFADSNYQASLDKPILLAAGNRADLLVKAPMLPAGKTSDTFELVVENTVDPSDISPANATAKRETLLTVIVDGNGQDVPFMATAPPQPAFLEDITAAEVKGTKKLMFGSTAPGAAPIANNPAQHTIDGKKFDGEVGAAVRLNSVEEWTISNATYAPNQISHPFHIHINPFQIVEVFDPSEALSNAKGTGKVTTTSGSPTVKGSGTSLMKEVQVGDFIWIKGENPATVLARTDNELTISNNAKGNAAEDGSYEVAVPLYTIDKATARAGQCLIDPADDTTWKPCNAKKPEDGIWWDVFPIPSGNTFTSAAGTAYKVPGHFKMRSRFVDYGGYFVLHCHILAHEDRGMMTVVHVSPLQPPYSHH
jgi:FtsP/CotA-like multicopper oxidase with cupredoxin domain